MIFSRQADIIKILGEELHNSENTFIESSELEIIANRWELGELATFVGQEGKISFPFTLNNTYLERSGGALDKLRETNHYLSLLTNSNRVYPHSRDSSNKEFSTLLYEWQSFRVSEPKLKIKGNKVILDYSYTYGLDIKNEEFQIAERRSIRKAVEKFHKDTYLEYYPEFKTIMEDHIEKFYSSLTDLEQVVSRSYEKEGTLYISALPEDLLTASHNSYGWRSCFAVSGEWFIAPFNYMRNENTMVAYFISKDSNKPTLSIGDYEVDNKEWRMFLFLTSEGNLAFSSNQYPFNSKAIEEEVAEILVEEFGGTYISKGVTVEREGDTYFDGAAGYIYFGSGEEDIDLDNPPISHDYITDYKTVCVHSDVYIGYQMDDFRAFVDESYLDINYCDSCEEYTSFEISEVQTPYGEEFLCESCIEHQLDEGTLYYDANDGYIYEREVAAPIVTVDGKIIHRYHPENIEASDLQNYDVVNLYIQKHKYKWKEGEYISTRVYKSYPVYIDKDSREWFADKPHFMYSICEGNYPVYADLEGFKGKYSSFNEMVKAIEERNNLEKE